MPLHSTQKECCNVTSAPFVTIGIEDLLRKIRSRCDRRETRRTRGREFESILIISLPRLVSPELITSCSANDHRFQRLLFLRVLTGMSLLFSPYRSSESSKAKSTCASSYCRWPRFVNSLDKSQVGTRSVGGLRRIGKPSSISQGDNFHYRHKYLRVTRRALFEKFMSRYS